MDFGFYQSLSRALMMHSDGLAHVKQTLHSDISALEKALPLLDSKNDREQFLKRHNTAFKVPAKFEPKPVRRDETEGSLITHKVVLDDMEHRRGILHDRWAIVSHSFKKQSSGLKREHFFLNKIAFG